VVAWASRRIVWPLARFVAPDDATLGEGNRTSRIFGARVSFAERWPRPLEEIRQEFLKVRAPVETDTERILPEAIAGECGGDLSGVIFRPAFTPRWRPPRARRFRRWARAYEIRAAQNGRANTATRGLVVPGLVIAVASWGGRPRPPVRKFYRAVSVTVVAR
jgi:hypothetical protein